MLVNRVQDLRVSRGMSRMDLAEKIGVTRQSVRLIEMNQMIPSALVALRLARTFHVSVEDLFCEVSDLQQEVFQSWPQDDLQVGDRVILADVGGRMVVRPALAQTTRIHVAPYVATVDKRLSGVQIRVKVSPGTEIRTSFVIAGCDLGLGVLAEHLQRSSPSLHENVMWLNIDNARATQQLSDQVVHIAAVHVPDTASEKSASNTHITRVHFADWQVGFIVQHGNPKGFSSVDDLSGGRLRMVNRPAGSGVRKLIERLLGEAQMDPSEIPQYTWEVAGHQQVAEAVASGIADVGVGIASAAAMYHLDFIPIQNERCELWIPNQILDTPDVKRALELLQSDVFRWDLERFGPCDVLRTGQIIKGES